MLSIAEIIKLGKKESIGMGFIKVPEYHDRTDVDPENIESLASNMSQVGQITPILVEKKDAEYELISGLRRYKAASKLGWDEIDAVVLENIDEQTKMLIMISENAQRLNLNDYDLVVSLVHFLAISTKKTDDEVKKFLFKLKNFATGKIKDLTLDEKQLKRDLEGSIVKTNRYSIKTLTNKLKVFNFHPDIIQALRDKRIIFSQASLINKVKDEIKMRELLTLFTSGQITKVELKKAVRIIIGENKIVFPFENFVKTLKVDFNNFSEEKKKLVQDKIAEVEKILSA